MSLMLGSEKCPNQGRQGLLCLGKGRSLKATTESYENAEKGFVQLSKE
jgi:hypothetical protein